VSKGFRLEPLGEDALLLRFGDEIDATINRRVHAVAAALGQERPGWLIDIVPAFATLALCIDVDAFDDTVAPLDHLRHWLASRAVDETSVDAEMPIRHHTIAVHYGGRFGPDLDVVAASAGLSPVEVVVRHTSAEYRVGMLGFSAGFPYLIGMDPALATPRRATPRTEVAAGSVGIAGGQTGVYPRSGPGGWQIIGHTEVRLFDIGRERPALLEPGDIVRFVDISNVAASAS
jgi:KipI family sensor histidine kinase inhibitor